MLLLIFYQHYFKRQYNIVLFLFVFLFIVSCDNETADEYHLTQLKKVSLSARSISEDIKTFIESGKAKVVLTMTTDKEGKTPATYYTSLTSEVKTLKEVILPIEKDGSIDEFFLESVNTYYIQQFDFYKTGVSLSNKPDYVIAELVRLTLKIEGDNQVTIPITLNETKTKYCTILPSLKVAFKTMKYTYFTKSNNIDLTIRYTKSGKTYTIIDEQDVFNCKEVTIEEDKWLKIHLDNKDGLYKGGNFTVAAKLHDYPSKGAIHEFMVTTDVDKQIRSGKLVLKMKNHLPNTTASNTSLTVNLSSIGRYDVKNQGNITMQDSDKDKLSMQYIYHIIYNSKRGYIPTKYSQKSFNKEMPKTLGELCPKCVQSDSQGNKSIIILSELKSFLTDKISEYYPYPSMDEWIASHPGLFGRARYVAWAATPSGSLFFWNNLRTSDFALRLSIKTNDSLQWTARKELLKIYFK